MIAITKYSFLIYLLHLWWGKHFLRTKLVAQSVDASTTHKGYISTKKRPEAFLNQRLRFSIRFFGNSLHRERLEPYFLDVHRN